MSCADVCIDMDVDANSDFFSESMSKARKPYVCCECGDAITVGSIYERASGKYEGRMWTTKTCRLCAEIRKALVCGGWYYGVLWEHIEEQSYPDFQIDCMVNIPSADARMKLWNGWREWQKDQR